ncbi:MULTISPECIES: hypothetical protein [Flavobacterium]|uniref:Lipoprotein n=1 Tax=Flavobacterium jumunjinense TaxID=998845 RepID=A0ABV5GQG3_9FLAO|nr:MULTISPECIES: hypothetical protein [Flavobacterium]
MRKNILKNGVLIVLLLALYSCDKVKKGENSEFETLDEKTEIIDNDNVLKQNVIKNTDVLTRQIQFGYSVSNDVTDIKHYQFNNDDIEVLENECSKTLLSNGYKFPSDEAFNNRVNNIFGTIHSNKSISYINLFDVCKKTASFSDSDGFRPNIFISKSKKLVVDQLLLPEIINYEELYPTIKDIENKVNTKFTSNNGDNIYVTRWKDVSDLDQQRKKNIQTLVARNMYLFNDSKAHFEWLILNDKYFMRSLVTTFGNYDDKELNKWVADNTDFKKDKIREISKVIYNQKCDDKIKVNYPLLEIIAEDLEKADEMYSFFRYDYFNMLLDKKNNLELTFSQKAEILARLHSFIFSNMKDYSEYKSMGEFAENYDNDNAYSKEFKAKNYYNIPDFEKQWKEAKQEGDGVPLPGE